MLPSGSDLETVLFPFRNSYYNTILMVAIFALLQKLLMIISINHRFLTLQDQIKFINTTITVLKVFSGTFVHLFDNINPNR